jgi:hypothetical protein
MKRSCVDVYSPFKRKWWTNSGGPLVNSELWDLTPSGGGVQLVMQKIRSTRICFSLEHRIDRFQGYLWLVWFGFVLFDCVWFGLVRLVRWSSRSNWVSRIPSPAAECVPPLVWGGGGDGGRYSKYICTFCRFRIFVFELGLHITGRFLWGT